MANFLTPFFRNGHTAQPARQRQRHVPPGTSFRKMQTDLNYIANRVNGAIPGSTVVCWDKFIPVHSVDFSPGSRKILYISNNPAVKVGIRAPGFNFKLYSFHFQQEHRHFRVLEEMLQNRTGYPARYTTTNETRMQVKEALHHMRRLAAENVYNMSSRAVAW